LTRTDAQGRFELVGPRPGALALELAAEGRPAVAIDIAADAIEGRFQIDASAKIRLAVDPSAAAIDAIVGFDAQGAVVPLGETCAASWWTPPSGRASLPAGRQLRALALWSRGAELARLDVASLPPGSTTEVAWP
jgi:hypothetical protein